MANPLLAVNYLAEIAIPINRLVRMGAADRTVTLATSATDAIIGAVNETPIALGERCDVVRMGICFVEAGAAIARGAPITSDGVGRGVTAAPATGINNRIVGFADEAASAAGDVIRMMIEPGSIQGQ